MAKLSEQLAAILDSGNGERAAHAFLKDHPLIVQNAFARAWNANICVAEFPLGAEWRADFLLLSADSGHWIATLIELETPSCRLYLKDGTPSKTLRIAQRQLKDWKSWVQENESYLRQQFAKILRAYGTAAQCSVADSHQKADTEVLDPRTVISFDYHIVIGRLSELSAEEQYRRVRERDVWGGPEIATYDRLLHAAKRLEPAIE